MGDCGASDCVASDWSGLVKPTGALVGLVISYGGEKQSSGLAKDEPSATPQPVSDEDVPRVTPTSVACEAVPRDSDSTSAAVLELTLESSAGYSGMLPEESVPEDDSRGCVAATASVPLLLGSLSELEPSLLLSLDGAITDVSVDALLQEDPSIPPASRSLFRQSSQISHLQERSMAV